MGGKKMKQYVPCLDENIEASYREAEEGEEGELALFTDVADLARRGKRTIDSYLYSINKFIYLSIEMSKEQQDLIMYIAELEEIAGK